MYEEDEPERMENAYSDAIGERPDAVGTMLTQKTRFRFVWSAEGDPFGRCAELNFHAVIQPKDAPPALNHPMDMRNGRSFIQIGIRNQ